MGSTPAASRGSLVLLFLGGLVACQAGEPGSFSITFSWKVPPQATVWLWARVEHRVEAGSAGPILASVGPVEFVPGGQVDLRMPSVPNGDDRVVVVEVREGSNATLRVLWFGLSEPFSLRAGDDQVVEVPLALQTPKTDTHAADVPVALLFDGVPRSRVNAAMVVDATVRVRSIGAVAAVLANDASFSASLRTVVLADDAGVSCHDEPDSGQAGLTWSVCDVEGWDLLAGLPDLDDTTYTVFAKLVDAYGYESAVHRDATTLDTHGPVALSATLSTTSARAGQPVLLTLTTQEPLADEPGAITLEVVPSTAPLAFVGPTRVPETTTYLWSATGPEGVEGLDVGVRVALTDELGNATPVADLRDDAGAPLTVTLDALPPRPADGFEVVLERGGEPDLAEEPLVFANPAEPDDPANRLSFDFVLLEPGVGALPVDDCGAGCPVVRLGERFAGEVVRAPHLDDATASRHGFRFEGTLDPAEWGPVEQDVPVRVAWSDRAGNAMEWELPRSLRLDFVAPTATDCVLSPDPATASDSLVYLVSASESLREAPRLTVDADGTPGLFTGEPASSAGGHTFTWSQAVEGVDATTVTVRAELTDRAGNRSDGPVCGATARLDGLVPRLEGGSVAGEPAVPDDGLGAGPAVGPRHVLRAAFRVLEEQSLAPGFPRVTLDAPVPVAFELVEARGVGEGATGFVAELRLADQVPPPADGAWPVVVALQDTLGNAATAPRLGDALVVVDTVAPGAACTLLPTPGDVLPGIGQTLVLLVSPSEPLAAGTEPALDVVLGAGPSNGFFELEGGSSYRYRHAITDLDGRGTFSARVSLQDRVGNRTDDGATACYGGLLEGGFDGERPVVSGVAVSGLDEVGAELAALRLRAGRRVRTTFELTGCEPGHVPIVTLGSGALAPAPGSPVTDAEGVLHWTFERTLAGDEGSGSASVSIAATDGAGNTGTYGADDQPVSLDFTDPFAECFVGRGEAKAGDDVTLSVSFSEPIEPASFVLTSSLAIEPVPAETDLDSDKPHATYVYHVPEGDGTYAWQFSLQATDRAGNPNPASALCTGGGAIDADPIRLLGADVTVQTALDGVPDGVLVTTPRARDASVVTISFTVDELPVEGSLLVLAGQTEVTGCALADHTFTCVHRVEAGALEPAQPEGSAAITVQMTDGADNQTYASLGTIERDYSPPALAGLPYFERADARARARLAANDLVVRPTDPVTVTFAITDGTGAPPAVTVGETSFVASGWRPGDKYVTVALTADVADGDLELAADVTDLAGNRASLALGRLRVDATSPAGLDEHAQGLVRLVRAPWGALTTDGEALNALRACPGGAAPSWSWCPEGEGPAFEPDLEVEVFKTRATEGEVRCTDDVLSAGTTDPLTGGLDLVVPGDWPWVCATLTDRAGNASERTRVATGLWIASLNGKVQGSSVENPHVVERVTSVREALLQAPYALEPSTTQIGSVAQRDGLTHSALAEHAWRQPWLFDINPDARSGAVAAYDTARGRLVLFGGELYQSLARDTWERLDTAWENGTPFGVNPPARSGYAVAYDAARGRVVLFGGCGFTDCLGREVWEWNGQAWTAIEAGPVAPPAREHHAMAYDGRRGRVVLFGGESVLGRFDDTWEWDGSTWLDRTPDSPSPAARTGHALAYDTARERVVLFGGETAPGLVADTWEWDGAEWRRAETPDTPAGTPTARHRHALVYDERLERTTLFGGTTYDVLLSDTWEWDGQAWLERGPDVSGRPEARAGHVLAFDRSRQRTILFGGEAFVADGHALLADTREWDGATWTSPVHAKEAAPQKRIYHAMAPHDGARQLVLFGGYLFAEGATGPLDLDLFQDTWLWEGDGWREAASLATKPTDRTTHAMTYDSKRKRTLLFGGVATAALWVDLKNDLWSWSGTAWSQLSQGTPRPPGRAQPALAYDASRDRAVLFGGCGAVDLFTSCTSMLGDTWEWSGTSWSQAATDPASSPPARVGGVLAADPVRGRTLLFGGCTAFNLVSSCTSYLSDSWEWDGAEWRKVALTGTRPSPRAAHTMAYDPGRGVIVLYGGAYSAGGVEYYLDDVWEWDGAAWRDVTPTDFRPPARAGHSMAYDATRGEMVVFGGFTRTAGQDDWNYLVDTWVRDSQPELRPALALRFDWGDARIETAAIEALDLLVTAGARGHALDLVPDASGRVSGEAREGADLWGWDAWSGDWTLLGSNSAGLGSPGDIFVQRSSAPEARRLVSVRSRQVELQVRPTGYEGNGPAPAEAALDYAEVRILYRAERSW